ncbi:MULTISPECIES: beta-ketoacyl synthase N-terminal-like domain-containing protein [Streptomyces]|uniref:beta-ketoacyl synthase N-terminal-like domain-containing protein n=1 Tax=Streptomyces TaxID=1883 RepID=UPI00089D6A7C|nr:beta-ketoacyl synthase N-terminal-like domain-containing protein [Streptomyces sp. PAN_FS17]SEB88658.1 3-oxoacyl-[acyl-carrier-protein] synthase II [Streptomyces sp. PAN_FS17]
MSAKGPVVSAWSAVSAFGVGREAFGAGVRAKVPAVTALDPERWAAPTDRACLVPGGEPRELLGRKGTRSMDRVTALAVAAVGRLLDDGEGTRIPGLAEDTGLVLGTSNGSVGSIMSFTRDSLTQDRPHLVDPARFPNTVMNCAAGQSAIRHGLRGPNVTIAGGRASALLALNHAQRLQRCGHARTVVCGAAEEFSAERAWLDWHARGEHLPAESGEAPLTGEGCAVLLLEAGTEAGAGRAPLAEVAAVEIALPADEKDAGPVLADCVRRALRRADLTPADLWALAPADATGPYGDRERTALAEVLGGHDPLRLSCTGLLGDTGAASAAFQIAALLASAEDDPAAAGRAALVTTADPDGVVGCAVLRLA